MTPQTNPFPRPIEVLLVEDLAADVRLIREALSESGVQHDLRVARTGDEALMLLKQAVSRREACPDLVLLDLNLPGKSGLEVLKELKAQPVLRRIPVVVLTTSGSPQDVQTSYALHANAFVTKPFDVEEFLYAIRQIQGFWMKVARLPS